VIERERGEREQLQGTINCLWTLVRVKRFGVNLIMRHFKLYSLNT